MYDFIGQLELKCVLNLAPAHNNVIVKNKMLNQTYRVCFTSCFYFGTTLCRF